MRSISTTLFLLLGLALQAQNFGFRLTAGATYLPDDSYYQTTVDLNGLKAVTMGTAENLVNIGSDLRDLFGQNYASIFKGDLPTVVQDGNTTYYNYDDKVITQQKKYVRETVAQIGGEVGFYSQPFCISTGLRNSKYRYIAPDFYAAAMIRPWEIVAFARGIISPFDHPEQFYDKLLSVFHIGYMVGNDMGTPGFLNFTQKNYQGLTFGASPTVDKFTVQLQGFYQLKHPKNMINQSHISASVLYRLN